MGPTCSLRVCCKHSSTRAAICTGGLTRLFHAGHGVVEGDDLGGPVRKHALVEPHLRSVIALLIILRGVVNEVSS